MINLGNGFASFGLRSALIPLFVVEALALGRQWTGYGLLVSALIQGVLLLPAGRMADTRGRKPALILGTAATTIGFVVLSLTNSLGLFLLAMAILGGGAAYLASAPAAVVGDMTGGKRGGPIVATYQMMSDVGAVAAPLIAGIIVDRTGSFAVGFLVGAGILGVGFVMSLFIRETLGTGGIAGTDVEFVHNVEGQGIDPDESPVHIQ
jgi:MFS family permease